MEINEIPLGDDTSSFMERVPEKAYRAVARWPGNTAYLPVRGTAWIALKSLQAVPELAERWDDLMHATLHATKAA